MRIVWILVVATCIAVSDSVLPADEPLLAGFAETDITPPVGFRKGGGYTEEFSTGVHDPLMAKGMMLRQGDASFVLVICDLLSVPEPLTTKARHTISERLSIPASHIVIAGTHNHASPEYWGPLRDIYHERELRTQGRDARESVNYHEFLRERWVQTVMDADAARVQVQLEACIAAQPGLAFNRRFQMRDDSVVTNPGKKNPEIVRPCGPVDVELPIVLFRPRGSQSARDSIGLLTIFAMHTAVFGGSEFGGDFPGSLQRELRHEWGNSLISLFGEGTAGDVNHYDVSTREPDPDSAQIGKTLSETIRASLPLLNPLQPALAVRSITVDAPLTPVTAERNQEARLLLEAAASRRVNSADLVAAWRDCMKWDIVQRYGTTDGKAAKPMEIQAVRLDADTALVTLPHEVFVEIGMAIKASSPFRRTLVLSLANDIDFYVPTRRAFEEGAYEVTNCPLDPGCGELMIHAAAGLLRELKP